MGLGPRSLAVFSPIGLGGCTIKINEIVLAMHHQAASCDTDNPPSYSVSIFETAGADPGFRSGGGGGGGGGYKCTGVADTPTTSNGQRGMGERCKLPHRGLGGAPAALQILHF